MIRLFRTSMMAALMLAGGTPLGSATEAASPQVVSAVSNTMVTLVVLVSVLALGFALLSLVLWLRVRSLSQSQARALSAVPARASTPPAMTAARKKDATERTTEVLIRQGLPAARMGGWERDIASGRITWSEHIHEIYGRTPDNMPTTVEELTALVHADDQAIVRNHIKRLPEVQTPIGLELRIVWPDGSVHWQATRTELVRDADGTPLRVVGIAMDITERKRIEDELRQSQRLLRVGFDAANIGAWEWDKRTGVVTWSAQVAPLFGMTPGAFDGSFVGYMALIHPDDTSTVQDAISRAMADGGGYRVEHRVKTQDGTIRWLAGRGDVVRAADGTSIGMAGVVLDITSRRLAEQILRDREERYRAVIASMHEGVVVYAADGSVIDCNQSAEAILGLSHQQLVGRGKDQSSWQAIHDDGSSFPPAQFPNAVAQGTGQPQYSVSMGIFRPDKALRWLSANAVPLLPVGGGTPLGVVVTFSDITDRRDAERALRDSEQRWRTLAENIPDTILLVDRTGTILFINRLQEGFTLESVLGAHIGSFMPKEFAKLQTDAIERVFNLGEVVSSDIQGEGPNHQMRWYSCHISPVRLHGRTIAATVRATDITQRHQAEDERQRFQSERELMFERMPIGCILWTKDRRISYANPAAEQTFGFSADGMNGHGLELINFEESMPEMQSYFERVEHGDMGMVAMVTNRAANGDDVTCEWHPTPLFGSNGELTGVITMVMDISERSSLEEQLRQAQKMEAVGRLAGGIAHDFNNLLTAIMGYSELLEARIPSIDTASGYVQQIKKAAKRAAALTYQLLAFSRKQVLQSQLIVLGDVITDLVPMLRRLIGEHITLKTDLAVDSWQILADASQMEQVVMNLVMNARDAMPLGGSLTITTRNQTMDADMVRAYAEVHPGDYLMMIITDTGEGMEDNVRRRIFEPFFTTKPEGKGTGLGLAVVFGVVRQSGGFIFVDSVPGKGSRFDVLLPRADRSPEPFRHRDSTAQLAIRGSETILLVEDDEGVRGLAKDTLEASGYTVMAVSNGAEAVEISEHYPKPIDLLLTDVVMPGLGGREVAEKVRAQRPAIKVLFMSGYTDDMVLAHGVQDGTAAFIEKPFAAPKLLGRIRKVLAGQM